MDTKNKPLTRGPKEGKRVSVVGATYRILVSGDETQGAFATIDRLVPHVAVRERAFLLYL
ncbi:hypothetical protein GCM10028818_00290 [Spirosoma horti]